jgi:hypothetical protein
LQKFSPGRARSDAAPPPSLKCVLENERGGAAEARAPNATEAKMEFSIGSVPDQQCGARFHYQYDSFQECNQAREAMAKDETGRQL